MLSGKSVSQSLRHDQLPLSAKIAESFATKLLVRHSEASQEILTKMIKRIMAKRQIYQKKPKDYCIWQNFLWRKNFVVSQSFTQLQLFSWKSWPCQSARQAYSKTFSLNSHFPLKIQKFPSHGSFVIYSTLCYGADIQGQTLFNYYLLLTVVIMIMVNFWLFLQQ